MIMERVAGTLRKSMAVKSYPANFGYGFATIQNPVWTVSRILLATGGRFVTGDPQARFRSISTDSRTIEPGDLFLALTGEHHDGSKFVKDAVDRGASGIVISQLPDPLPPVPVICVPDTLKALGDLSAYRRSQLKNVKVMAITGSSGKTTVKEMTAAIMSCKYKILKTEGNFNNLIGLPLSLLPIDYRHDFAILEMGMNRPGEIARMTEIADPDIACINNIQEAHIEGLHDLDGVARAKGELFAGLKAWGKLVVNMDDAKIRKLARKYKQEKITFGRHRRAFVRATHIAATGEEGVRFTLHLGSRSRRLKMRCLGSHNVMNALAAAALAYSVGVRMKTIVKGLEKFVSYDKRSQLQKLANGLRVINDAYNANPSSMEAALVTLSQLRGEDKAVAIVGDMLEMGEQSGAAHRRIGSRVAGLNIDYLYAYGPYAREIVKAARKSGMPEERAVHFGAKEEIVEAICGLQEKKVLGPGDWVLVKGSRGMKMEEILEGLQARLGAGE
mgnify:CR=1 FL=1